MELKQKRLNEMTEEEKTKNAEYSAFLDKFEPKLTTDDCYTPANVYNVISEYVASCYGLDCQNFVRPFYPGGDYVNFDYPSDCVVVDNPPFSILSKIVDFYLSHNIKFFLFGPSLTIFNVMYNKAGMSCVIMDCNIEYENGANVPTSFVTNLDDAENIRTAPELNAAIIAANEENRRSRVATLPKYKYPDHVLTVSKLKTICKNGIELRLNMSDLAFTRRLDAQKSHKKVIFGSGYIMSDAAAAVVANAAAAAAAEKDRIEWKLSDRELDIIKNLNE